MGFRVVLVLLVCTGMAAVRPLRAEDLGVAVAQDEPYCPKQEVMGQIELVGSTTMQQLAALWADGFRKIHPQVEVLIDCRGSETALPSLAGRRPTRERPVVGLMSRPLGKEEKERLAGQLGYRIVGLTACYDALGLIVHKENPLLGVTWGRARGLLHHTDWPVIPEKWGDWGLKDDWAALPIRLHAPTAQSGTRNYLERLLPASQASPRAIVEHASHEALVHAVAADRSSLGLVSLSRGGLDGVRVLPVAADGQDYVTPDVEEIRSGRYSLMRALTLVVLLSGENLQEQPLLEEFLDYILSRNGQQDVTKDGFYR